MAPRVTPTAPDADNPSGSFMPAASNDWRSADADSMSARARIAQPNSDAGYTTAGSSLGALTRSINHWGWQAGESNCELLALTRLSPRKLPSFLQSLQQQADEQEQEGAEHCPGEIRV